MRTKMVPIGCTLEALFGFSSGLKPFCTELLDGAILGEIGVSFASTVSFCGIATGGRVGSNEALLGETVGAVMSFDAAVRIASSFVGTPLGCEVPMVR
mmetsp:Transcript_19193/g.19464  ORF Transcript_19193/g.19464 Transcript_19193/m.19464 type:complete len:98 (-) Transcript_19193:177-470(-)